jgi:GntR family transcriptional regulator
MHDHMTLEDRSGRIDHAKPEHIWAQVAADIRADIAAGRLSPGAKLPGEIELAGQYGVARLTVRRAIRELVAEDRLVILRGRGTYVKQRDS